MPAPVIKFGQPGLAFLAIKRARCLQPLQASGARGALGGGGFEGALEGRFCTPGGRALRQEGMTGRQEVTGGGGRARGAGEGVRLALSKREAREGLERLVLEGVQRSCSGC